MPWQRGWVNQLLVGPARCDACQGSPGRVPGISLLQCNHISEQQHLLNWFQWVSMYYFVRRIQAADSYHPWTKLLILSRPMTHAPTLVSKIAGKEYVHALGFTGHPTAGVFTCLFGKERVAGQSGACWGHAEKKKTTHTQLDAPLAKSPVPDFIISLLPHLIFCHSVVFVELKGDFLLIRSL